MRKDCLELVDRGFYKRHNRYLSDIQRDILLKCYDSNPNLDNLAEELGFASGTITGYAAELWKLLSDVFEEKVTKKNLQGAVERYLNKGDELLDSKPSKPFKIFISERSQNSEPSKIEQLKKILQETGQETIIGDNWLQYSEEELNECACFLLIVSSYSTDESDIITQEVQRARELRDNRQEKTLAILLIHFNSLMSLPLNHPLNQNLQDIPQLEWHSSTELSTLVEEVMKSWQQKNQSETDELNILITNLRKLEISDNWMLTYVGENQLYQLGNLVRDLKNHKIQSGYAYWGVGPTLMWAKACNDPTYHMGENLQQFPRYAKPLAQYVDKELYNFVSLGVGEGSKDSNIIKDFFNRDENSKPRDDFLYLPVDMSLDMLRIAISKIQELPSHRRIAIQRNIETKDGMKQIAHIAKVLGKEKPILYGFIGNTIANVEDPEQVLDNIVQIMNPRDLLLFEAQVIDESALRDNQLAQTIQSVRGEYEGVSFRQFALSALLQNSDLSIEPWEKDSCYLVEASLQPWKYGQILQIDCWFKNNTDREIYLTFSNEDITMLNLQEQISLYRSRKFTQVTLKNFVRTMNLNILETSTYLSNKGTGFMVMILQRQN